MGRCKTFVLVTFFGVASVCLVNANESVSDEPELAVALLGVAIVILLVLLHLLCRKACCGDEEDLFASDDEYTAQHQAIASAIIAQLFRSCSVLLKQYSKDNTVT